MILTRSVTSGEIVLFEGTGSMPAYGQELSPRARRYEFLVSTRTVPLRVHFIDICAERTRGLVAIYTRVVS